ncbi:MAG: 2,3,4,5-tetrahydropyridine-2,6-dicarboxylate N-succinyltransferase, partial [Candidatus Macondimonas sp.]
MTALQQTIEAAFEDRAQLTPQDAPAAVRRAVQDALALL